MSYYVKSLDSDHTTKTLVGDKRVTCQTLKEIVLTKRIKTNTKSFGHERRLSTTILHKNYLKTYRPQGIIFTTVLKPDYVLPFDLILAAQSENIVIHYYLMKDNLRAFYNHALIPGYKKFVFKNIHALVHRYPSPWHAWKAVNEFRLSKGQKRLPKQKFRLCEYNEAVFTKTVHIKPLAVFGYRKQTKALAHKLGLPHFRTAKNFCLKNSLL